MYRIINIDGTELGITDSVTYIKILDNGSFTTATAEDAIGVAFSGTAYNLFGHRDIENAETVLVSRVDGGNIIGNVQNQSNNTAKLSGQVAVAAKMSVRDSTEIEDEDALKMPDLFRTWKEVLARGVALAAHTIINKDGKLYRVQNIVTPMEHQPPDGEGMLALYRPIDITHAGTKEDPIAWEYGMDCSAGLYYTYAGETWYCAGDMKPCVWYPGTAGVWQWEKVEATS